MNEASGQPSLNRDAVTQALERLYHRYGYCRYRMNRFEEYDLYARNKDFLVSDSVITFTDTSGKLMALKPDVTLSIVKNTLDTPGTIRKLCYSESVYRISPRNHCFQELPQIGLEAIGEVDEYALYEVLKLAAESLACTGQSCVLEISHLGLLDDVIRYAGIRSQDQDRVLACIGSKNLHELSSLCRELAIEDSRTQLLLSLAACFGTPEEVLDKVNRLLDGIADPEALAGFNRVIRAMEAGKYGSLIRIDFSVTGSLRYYNGFVFKGYVQGIPQAILSGGQYDRLLKSMGKSSGAVGFAVYMDTLEEYLSPRTEYDVDVLLVCSPGCSISAVETRARELTADGSSLQIQHQIPPDLRYRRLVRLEKEDAE